MQKSKISMSKKLIALDIKKLFGHRFRCDDPYCQCELELTTDEARAIIRIINAKKYGKNKKSGSDR